MTLEYHWGASFCVKTEWLKVFLRYEVDGKSVTRYPVLFNPQGNF